ncbi:MAG: DUF547 domain-containing protein [Pseudomonadota bacterium]
MIRISFAAAFVIALAACQTPPSTSAPEATAPVASGAPSAGPIMAFAPEPSGVSTSIDYNVIDSFLDAAVIPLGPSTRTRLRTSRDFVLGTNLRFGHTSRLRLEGNKIPFSKLTPKTRAATAEYLNSLVVIGNSVELTKLRRDEQLAYWFNLHNMMVISAIAQQYPVRNPREMEIDGVPLHDAKLVTIKGVPLSLRDIRTRIVYAHWQDPRVIYGFFHGDLASPSIRNKAWKRRDLKRNLNSNAKEFINSLRGVDNLGDDELRVSPLYEEARGLLFPEWPTDFKDHLLDFANTEVAELVQTRGEVKFSAYEQTVADLAGGQPYENAFTRYSTEDPAVRDLPPSARDMFAAIQEKFESAEFRALRRGGTVTIIDQDDAEDDEGDLE